MSRTKGAKNIRPRFYSIDTLQKKSETLSDRIDKFINEALGNMYFNKLVDFDSLHKVKDDLKKLSKENLQ